MGSKMFSILAVAGLVTPMFAAGIVHADDFTGNSTADFNVSTSNTNPDQPGKTDPDGKLTLQSVPSFKFGTVKSSEVYNGFSDKAATDVTDKVDITDYRDSTHAGWNLSVSRGQFGDLTGSSLSFSSDPSSLDATVFLNAVSSDDGQAADVAKSETSHGEFKLIPKNAKLSLAANPQASLTDGQNFNSNMTWNLSTSAPQTLALH